MSVFCPNCGKRTYDEYQHESLESIRRNRSITDKTISDAQQHDNQLSNVALQALQNAVETANLIGKQAAQHRDLAVDRQWNVNETDYAATDIIKAISGDTNAQKALADLLVKIVGTSVKEEPVK